MVRSKRTEETRGRLVSTATELFLKAGYESTSVDSVLAGAGLSKGTFYHHFRSKADLLDAVVDRYTAGAVGAVRRSFQETEGTALDRLNAFFSATWQWRRSSAPGSSALARSVFSRQNVQLRERIRERALEEGSPLVLQIVRQGVEEGQMDVPDPEAATRILLLTAQAARDDFLGEVLFSARTPEELLPELRARQEALYRAMEGILGLDAKSLVRPPESDLAKFLAAHSGPGG